MVAAVPDSILLDAGTGDAFYAVPMPVTVELPEDAIARLRAEATRRGVSIDVVIAELATRLPAVDPLESFIGCGASGRTEPFDIHHERAELAAKKLAEGV
ncbi:MAG: hypothetical protein ABI658_12460 [Acidimicrobiales bacterium]